MVINHTWRAMMAKGLSASLLILAFVLGLTPTRSASAVVLTFRDGVNSYAGTQDTYVGGNVAFNSSPQGNGNLLYVYEREQPTINDARILIRYDLSSISPSTTITSATLTFTLPVYAFGTGNIPTSLYLVNAADGAWTEAQATWNNLNQSTSTPWTGGVGLTNTGNADFNPTAIATINSPPNGWAEGTLMTFTLNTAGITAIDNWIANPSTNYGFFIRQGTGTPGAYNDGFVQIYSSEATTVADRPLLTLVAPEPASAGLLIAGGAMLLRRRRA